MPDSKITGLTDDERTCVEALARVYVEVNGEDMALDRQDREDLSRCVRCIQDRIFALPTKRKLRTSVIEDEGGNTIGQSTPPVG